MDGVAAGLALGRVERVDWGRAVVPEEAVVKVEARVRHGNHLG